MEENQTLTLKNLLSAYAKILEQPYTPDCVFSFAEDLQSYKVSLMYTPKNFRLKDMRCQ